MDVRVLIKGGKKFTSVSDRMNTDEIINILKKKFKKNEKLLQNNEMEYEEAKKMETKIERSSKEIKGQLK